MKNPTRDDILYGSIPKNLMLFFFPVLLGYLFQQLYNTVDAMIVGKFVGKIALAAVGGTTGTSINLIVNFIWGLTSGISVIVAQYYGRKDSVGVQKAVRTGMFLGLILGTIMMVVGIIFTPALLSLLKVPDEVYSLSVSYMQLFLVGLPPFMVYNVGSSILRATGDSKRPLYFLIVAAFTNMVLDYIFVKYFHWGVHGAAIATVIAQIISCVLVLMIFKNTSDVYHFELKDFGFDFELLKKSLLLGLPSGIQSSLYSISNLFIQTSVNSFGTDVMAAYTAFGKIDGFYWNYDSAFGIACMTVVGQNYGVRNKKRVKETVRISLGLEVVGTLLFSAITFFGAKWLVLLFTDDPTVIEIGVKMCRLLAIFWVLFNPIEIISSACKACGDVFVPMVTTAVCICGIRVLYLLVFNYSTVLEALYCYPISWLIASIIFVIYYFKGHWMKENI